MNKEEWLKKFADRIVERADVSPDIGNDVAQANLEALDGDDLDDPCNEPVAMADEELSYWTDDGE